MGVLREFGPLKSWIYLGDRAVSRWGGRIHLYAVVAQPVATAPLLGSRRGGAVVVRMVNCPDLLTKSLPLDSNVVAYRMGQGAVCFGAFRGDAIIGCLWLCLGSYQEDEVRCIFRPPADCSWDFDVYIKPEHRAGIAFASLWDAANQFLRSRGAKWSMSRISVLNSRSMSAHGRLGATPIGSMLFFRLCRAQLAISSVAPYVHFSTSTSRIPVFTLAPPDISCVRTDLPVGGRPSPSPGK